MDEKLKIITDLLIKKTKNNEVAWLRLDDNAFSLEFNNNLIIINNYFTTFRAKRKIKLLILNNKNEVMSTTSEDNISLLRDLYKLANDNLNKKDLDNIIQALL